MNVLFVIKFVNSAPTSPNGCTKVKICKTINSSKFSVLYLHVRFEDETRVTERNGLKTNVTCNEYTVIQRLNVTILPSTHPESNAPMQNLICTCSFMGA